MSKRKRQEERSELERQARYVLDTQGSPGLLVQLHVMLANDVHHLGNAVGEIRGTLAILVPLTIAVLAFNAISFFK